MADPIRVILADDHPLVRNGIRAVLADEPGITLVGEAADGAEAMQLCTENEADILLLDLSMPGPPAAKVVEHLAENCPDTKTIILSAYDDDVHVRAMVRAGVVGYILKSEATDMVVGAILAVQGGGNWFSQAVMQKIIRWQTGTPVTGRTDRLSEREIMILERIALGWDNVQIAHDLFLAEQTIRNYTSRIYGKLGVRTRAEAVVWAREHDIIGDHPFPPAV